jgi:hypothetical protein
MLAALEVGDWRAVLHLARTRPDARIVVGSARDTQLAAMLRLMARSMELQAMGDAHDAWDRLEEAAKGLPIALRMPVRASQPSLAALVLEPPGGRADVMLTWRAARLVWREQFELAGLRRRFAPGLMKPRDELVEACIEHISWIEFDPFTWYRPAGGRTSGPTDRTSVARERSLLCSRGTRLRQFADPTAGEISQSVWRDIGGYRGLCAEALDRLADRPTPAPWCGAERTAGLEVRRGRLRAWEYARDRGDDLGYWK